MRKSSRKPRTGNPARRRRAAGAGNRRRNWSRWLGRETATFFDLPEWQVTLIVLLAVAAGLAVWRLFAG